MTFSTVLIIGVAGGIGAAARFAIDKALPKRPIPWGTFTVNLLGSFLLGVFTGFWRDGGALGELWLAILGTGFCGGFTTFSTASLDVVELLRTNRRTAWAYQGGMLLACLFAGLIGLLISS